MTNGALIMDVSVDNMKRNQLNNFANGKYLIKIMDENKFI